MNPCGILTGLDRLGVTLERWESDGWHCPLGTDEPIPLNLRCAIDVHTETLLWTMTRRTGKCPGYYRPPGYPPAGRGGAGT